MTGRPMPVPPAGADRGTTALELVIVAPVLLALLMLVIYGGRVVGAESNVQSAASAAARAASLTGSPGGAEAAVDEIAAASLSDADLSCSGGPAAQIVWAETDFSPGGHVTVQVSCRADVSGLWFIGAPPYTATASATEVIDTLRGEGG